MSLDKVALVFAVIACFLSLITGGDSLEDVVHPDLSNGTLYYDGGGLVYGNSSVPLNLTVYSPNGSVFLCGVNDTGSWLCW